MVSRINARVAAAIQRAAARYSSEQFYFVAPAGARVKIAAVKRDADTDALAPVSGVASARRFEFIVTRQDFAAVCSLLAVAQSDAAALFDALRRSMIVSVNAEGRERKYALDAARPIQENSPDAGSVRLFCYEA